MSSRKVVVGTLTALLVGIGSAGTVAGSSAEPIAVAAKKKCEGPLWKCAPKRYHLSATDTVGPGPQSPGFQENWSAEVDLVRIARTPGKVDYGSAGGRVRVSGGSLATVCEDGSPATVRIQPQTIAVPRGPGYPFLGDFGVEFSLIGRDKNTYGGPLGTQGSELYTTAIDPCPNGAGAYQVPLFTPREGVEGRGKPGRVLTGSDTFTTLFEEHSFSWKLTPKR
jgi:hypothetical protein